MNVGPDDDFALDDGEGSLTPTEKIVMDEDDNDQLSAQQPPVSPAAHDRQRAVTTVTTGDDNAVFDDGLFEDSSDTLSNAPMDMDDRDDEDEEEPLLSSLSLTGDNAPLSPDPDPEHEHESREEEDDNEQQKSESDTTVAKEEKQQQQQGNGIVNETQEDTHMKDEDDEKVQTKSTVSPVKESSAAATTTAESSSSNPTPPSPSSMVQGDKKEDQHQQSKISDNDNDTSPTPQSPTTSSSSSRKRRGSQTLEEEEWQQRRTSKIMEFKDQQNGADPVSEDSQLPSSSEPEPKEESNQEQDDKQDKDEDEDGCDQEYQQWHKEALDALTKIEVEFARLRDKMYQEKMSELNEEALMIAQGTHPELMAMMETIEKKKNQRIQTADAWRKYKRVSYQRQFEGLEYQANIDFVCGKNGLRRSILDTLNRKRWDLDTERDKLNEPLTDADRVPDPNVLVHRKRGQTDETRDLHRITHSIGFPMAPKAEGLAKDSVEDDLVALGIIPATTATNQEKKSSTFNMTRDTLKPKVLDTPLETNVSAIYAYQGHLHYHGKVFRKGDQFTVVDANAGRYSAKLLTATDTEAHIQRTDGSKTKLPFVQMSRGKYQLYAKHS